jgi:hypothetical protein
MELLDNYFIGITNINKQPVQYSQIEYEYCSLNLLSNNIDGFGKLFIHLIKKILCINLTKEN